VGEFNSWKNGSLALSKYPDGHWELTLALPAGHYPYLYMVDGQPRPDPQSKESAEFKGRKVSIKAVR
jgi:hypothetical protein